MTTRPFPPLRASGRMRVGRDRRGGDRRRLCVRDVRPGARPADRPVNGVEIHQSDLAMAEEDVGQNLPQDAARTPSATTW